MVHPFEDSDSSEDEVDWQDTRHDPYRAGISEKVDLGVKLLSSVNPFISFMDISVWMFFRQTPDDSEERLCGKR